MLRRESLRLYQSAKTYMPGGVNSPARSWQAVGGTPVFIARGYGSNIWDVDGNDYIDYVGSWGPLILGHAHSLVLDRIKNVLENGTGFGAPTEIETRLASEVVNAFPSIDLIRFVNSGTEAAMSALRLARAYTRRDKIIKFRGGYHGHTDALLVKAGSGAASHGIPDSSGVTKSFAADTLVAEYNDLDSVEVYLNQYPNEIAAVIVEPVAGNMGVIPSSPEFLMGLREITSLNSVLLIFDEVITGFRLTYGGAEKIYNIAPDITCLGKIIGGGMPVGAYGGTREIMEEVAPLGTMYQAGTLSGNPVAMAAGVVTLEILKREGTYEALEIKGRLLEGYIESAFYDTSVQVTVNRVGSMLTPFFTDRDVVTNWESVEACDIRTYADFFHGLLDNGIYFPPSPFESAFVSTAHSDADLEHTNEVIRKVAGLLTRC